jgi:hypothetical protein
MCLRYIIGWATEASRMDSDFHREIPESYVLDKTKLEQVEVGGKIMNFYYPTKSEIKVIAKEMQKIATNLIIQRVKTKEKYDKRNK